MTAPTRTWPDELPSVVPRIEQRLRQLVERARALNTTGDIAPPAQASLFPEADSISSFPDHFDGQHNQGAFEIAARTIFYDDLLATSSNIDRPAFAQVWHLLDIIQIAADNEQCDASLSLWLIEELLESKTIDGCKKIFDYLESRRDRLNKGSNLVILRSCNELLRRLSRAEEAVFCGRVFIFMFQALPFGDKSSVNLRGEFHVDNKTTFDDIHANAGNAATTFMHLEQDDSMGAEEDKKDIPIALDDLYPAFWSMQHVFSNPLRLFNAPEMKSFQNGLAMTLAKFNEVAKLQAPARSQSPDAAVTGSKRRRDGSDEYDDFTSTFNPKYLTSRDLFALELRDLTFQRHILVQALIMVEFLLSFSPKAKKKLASTQIKVQKAMEYNYTLNEDDEKWTHKIRRDIGSYLSDLPEGKFYYRMVTTILARDKNWLMWKLESCLPFKKPPLPMSKFREAMESLAAMCKPTKLEARPMGSCDLSFLDDSFGGNEERMEEYKIARQPDLYPEFDDEELSQGMQYHLGEIGEAELDLDMMEGGKLPQEFKVEAKRLSEAQVVEREKIMAEQRVRAPVEAIKTANTWKLLRLGCMRDFSVFHKVDANDENSLRGFVQEPEPQSESQPVDANDENPLRDFVQEPELQSESQSEAKPETKSGYNADSKVENVTTSNQAQQENGEGQAQYVQAQEEHPGAQTEQLEAPKQ